MKCFEVDDAYLYNEDIIHVSYKKKEPYLEESNSSNVIVAAYVTAYARLKLFKIINSLGNRCLYYDTDSVIFTAKPGEYIPKTGEFLGQLTNELNDSSDFITKFLSCGPKTYCMEIYSPKSKQKDYMIKIKGLSLNFETTQLVNFNSMKRLIDEYILNTRIDKILVKQHKFVTTPYNDIKTCTIDKLFKLVYDKRMLNKDYTTLPFGYKE